MCIGCVIEVPGRDSDRGNWEEANEPKHLGESSLLAENVRKITFLLWWRFEI